jgi:hypothetical protein
LTQAARAVHIARRGTCGRSSTASTPDEAGAEAIAASHKILVIAFQVLRTDTPYRELGGDYFDRLNLVRTARKLVQRLEALGHEMQLSPILKHWSIYR